MLVYGDRARRVDAAATLDALSCAIDGAFRLPPGVVRHGAMVEAFVGAGEYLQGVADGEMEEAGVDRRTPAQDAAMQLLMELARSVAASWGSGFAGGVPPCAGTLSVVRALAPAAPISCRTAEGHAYYAVYPEAYLEAARTAGWTSPPRVIGVRSIGAGLSAMVAVAAGSGPPQTVRPVGHPFDRRLSLAPQLRGAIVGEPAAAYAVVDEGPGLSGSSFGAVGDLLEDAGVPAQAITFMPSHGGEPGGMASTRRAQRWRSGHRVYKDFDAFCLAAERPEHRLEGWCRDLTGPLTEPLRDISGGGWREIAGRRAPVIASLERRKFLARSDSGTWLLKFTGLGPDGRARSSRARILAAAGHTPEVLGLRHGFMVQRWCEDTGVLDPGRLDRDLMIDRLARYIAFRAERFPAGADDGASLAELARMAEVNAMEGLGEAVGASLARRLSALARRVPRQRRVHVDGRMHAWEWLTTSQGGLLKVDAVDHSRQHDLVGCQDAAWDVIGAGVELGLSAEETDLLARRTGRLAGAPLDRTLLEMFAVCYPAFQLGLWSLAGGGDDARLAAAHAGRYADALRAEAG